MHQINSKGLLGGFRPVFASEMRKWFGSPQVWLHLLVWTVVTNGMLLLILLNQAQMPAEITNVETLAQMLIMGLGNFAALGVMVVSQYSLIQELTTGTTEWVLSKPVSRSAYLLAKYAGSIVSSTLLIVIPQSLVGFLLLNSFEGIVVDLDDYLSAMLTMLISLFFFTAWALFVGSYVRNLPMSTGALLALVFVQQPLVSAVPSLANFLPIGQAYLAQMQIVGANLDTVDTSINSIILIEIVLLLVFSVVRMRKMEF